MTNFEKYKDEISNITGCRFGVVDGRPFSCGSIVCKDCEIQYNNDCLRSRWLWLISEHKEQKISIPKDTPIDAKVLVSKDGEDWAKRHYAGCVDGVHMAWYVGKTSWTTPSHDNRTAWEYMKLYE